MGDVWLVNFEIPHRYMKVGALFMHQIGWTIQRQSHNLGRISSLTLQPRYRRFRRRLGRRIGAIAAAAAALPGGVGQALEPTSKTSINDNETSSLDIHYVAD